MTDKQLKEELNKLYRLYSKGMDIKIILAKSVQLGMDYQEQKIKEGIDIVFKALHEKMEVN